MRRGQIASLGVSSLVYEQVWRDLRGNPPYGETWVRFSATYPMTCDSNHSPKRGRAGPAGYLPCREGRMPTRWTRGNFVRHNRAHVGGIPMLILNPPADRRSH